MEIKFRLEEDLPVLHIKADDYPNNKNIEHDMMEVFVDSGKIHNLIVEDADGGYIIKIKPHSS